MASGQPTFDAESLINADKHGKKWLDRPHQEDSLHDLVSEHKYDFNISYLSNYHLFISKIQHPFGTAVLQSPTYRDLQWKHETGKDDAFSTAQYQAYNEFEQFLQDNVQGAVDKQFSTLSSAERRLITVKTLLLIRCAPAGTIDTEKILKSRGSKGFIEVSEEASYPLTGTPPGSSLKDIRVLILKGALNETELQAYTAADQVTAEQGDGDEPRPPRRSAGGAHGLSGLFEIDGIESPVELNSHPGRTTFLNQIFHNLNGGSPGNAVDELINYYENVIRGHIKKFTAGQCNSVTGTYQESTYCEESGMEAIWLAKSGPKGLLARTEGWENNPAGGMMRRGAAYMRMFEAYLKTSPTDAYCSSADRAKVHRKWNTM